MYPPADTLVIGTGQAGLGAGYHLQRAGQSFTILDAAAEPGGSWPQYCESLRLFSPARFSSLPGLRFPGDPERYPARDEVITSSGSEVNQECSVTIVMGRAIVNVPGSRIHHDAAN